MEGFLPMFVGLCGAIMAGLALRSTEGLQGPTGQQGQQGPQGPQGFSTGAIYFLNYNLVATNPVPVGPPTYYNMDREILSVGTNALGPFTQDGPISYFVTDPLDPYQAEIPSGVWTFHQHFSSVTKTGTPSTPVPSIYVAIFVYKDNGTIVGPIATNVAAPVPLQEANFNVWYDIPVSFVSAYALDLTDRIMVTQYVSDMGYVDPSNRWNVTATYGSDTPSQVITTLSPAIEGPSGPTGPMGLTGATGPSGVPGIIQGFGNTILVDAVYGNDLTGTVNSGPFQTVNAAMTYLNTLSELTYPNVTVWIMPGAYTLTSGLTMRANSSIRGLSTQTSKLTWAASAPGSTATLLTMASNSRVEDVTLTLTSTNATTNLVGVLVNGATATSSKLRTCVLTVDNSTLAVGASTNVYGVFVTGTAALSAGTFSFNFTRGVTVNVFSNGSGAKRGIYTATANQITFRDTNIYVRNPTNTASTGTYVGCETADATGTGSCQFRTSSIYGCQQQSVLTSLGYAFTGSDILQSFPASGFNIYGVQIGPGTDLVNKSAGTRPFTTYVTPTVLTYGLNGSVSNSVRYYWPGTLSTGDSVETFYRIQQDCVLNGASVNLRTAPGGTNSVTWTVRKSTTNVPPGVPTTMTLTVSGASTTATNYNTSVDLARGDFISVQSSATGGAAQDFILQLDIF